MRESAAIRAAAPPVIERPAAQALRLLWHDKFALVAACYLALVALCALFGPALLEDAATKMNLRGRNAPPFTLEQGWLYVLGADALGRSILARLVVAAQNTIAVAAAAVAVAMTVGGVLGLIAGYGGGFVGNLIMRLADIIMSFPSLLLAVVVLYMFEPRVANLVIVLAITRIPIYLRTTRAEVLELRERMFVSAARVMGAGPVRIVWRHIVPLLASTLITIATVDFAFVMLAESALSFLGIGIQPPGDHLGTDGRPGAQLPRHRLVAGVLARARDHADHARPQPPVQLDAHRHRPGAALASRSGGRTGVSAAGHLLEVQGLAVEFHTAGGKVHAVNGVDWHVDSGEVLAILGESGSGKSVSAAAIMNLIDSPPGYVTAGRILYRGEDLLSMSAEARRRINGRRIAMIFQDPLAHLNPVYSVGWQIAETLTAHRAASGRAAKARAIELLDRVGIGQPERRAADYPHQFSGGQRQRVMIAMALALRPEVLIADEPTTALDVTIQAQILKLLKELQAETGMGLILITHDLGVVAEVADRVAVMHAGQIVETGPVRAIYDAPQHPYTQRLMAAIPGRQPLGGRTAGAFDAGREPLLRVRDLARHYAVTTGLMRRTTGETVRAVDGVSFDLCAGETLGLVGESGSGKSTLARTLLRLEEPTDGSAEFRGQDVFALPPGELLRLRRKIQVVFQDPYASLNPRMTVAQLIAEPWSIHRDVLPKQKWQARVCELLEQVGMAPEHARRYPHQFSGGQRQRIAIARALALQPELIVCDEAVSALDVSIQAQVIALLSELRRTFSLAYIFIAHDLPVVRHFADRVMVMYQGRIVEQGPTEQIFERPQHPYTRTLLAATPVPDPDAPRRRAGGRPTRPDGAVGMHAAEDSSA